MKRLITLFAAFCCLFVGLIAAGTVNVKGYYRKDGTYVAPHTRSAPGSKASTATPTPTRPAAVKSTPTPGPTQSSSSSDATTIKPAPGVAGWASLVSGMGADELKQQLGSPDSVEKKSSFDRWIYPSGWVFVKEGKVLAWQEIKTKEAPVTASAGKPSGAEANQSEEAKETKKQGQEMNYWITLSSGVRHNANCRYYQNSKGRPCTKDEGRPCKICGG